MLAPAEKPLTECFGICRRGGVGATMSLFTDAAAAAAATKTNRTSISVLARACCRSRASKVKQYPSTATTPEVLTCFCVASDC